MTDRNLTQLERLQDARMIAKIQADELAKKFGNNQGYSGGSSD
jgi:hypothetical protein